MKPIIKYRGGKSKEITQFEQFIPRDYDRYIEPFLGGGAVYFHLSPEQAIINDINPRLIDFYLGVQQNYEQVREECLRVGEIYAENRRLFEQLKRGNPNERIEDNNEALYYNLRDMYNGLVPSDYSYAFLYYFINKTAFSGMIRYNAAGEFNVPYGRYKSFSAEGITPEHANLLRRTQILNVDYEAVFGMANAGDFIFLDPPYMCTFSDYGNIDDFTEGEHVRLANNYHNLHCRALMVIGASPLIRELYAGNIIGEYEKNYAVNIRNRFHSASQHLIIANY